MPQQHMGTFNAYISYITPSICATCWMSFSGILRMNCTVEVFNWDKLLFGSEDSKLICLKNQNKELKGSLMTTSKQGYHSLKVYCYNWPLSQSYTLNCSYGLMWNMYILGNCLLSPYMLEYICNYISWRLKLTITLWLLSGSDNGWRDFTFTYWHFWISRIKSLTVH